MKQKITITIDREVYDALYRVVGKGNISKFLENLARPHVLKEDLISAYRAMAADTEREHEALEWSNGLIAQTDCVLVNLSLLSTTKSTGSIEKF
jgi:predicted CopG family antitoxin